MNSTARLVIAIVICVCAGTASAGTPELPAGRDFGAGIALSEAIPLGQVLGSPDAHTETPVLVRGRLADVCQKKGCWTVLAEGAHQIRVRFEDYGFFLPKDAIGEEAFVEGVVTVRTLSEREARHYAEESSAGDPDAISGPQREVGFLASGVRLVGPASAPAD